MLPNQVRHTLAPVLNWAVLYTRDNKQGPNIAITGNP